MIERKVPRTAKIGVFGVGHGVYWDQFPGLYEKLLEYHEDFKKTVAENGVEIIDYGMVDSSEKSYQTLRKIKGDCVDLLFCNMLTYATSSVFAPIMRDADCPMVLTALQPLNHMDYGKANTRQQLENDCICSVPEFTGVAVRLGKKVADVIIGTLYNDEKAKSEIAEWCDIAKVLHGLHGARFGLMGHVLEAMYDMHADPTAVSAAFGVHVPLFEVDDVIKIVLEVTKAEMKEKKELILREFDTPDPISDPITKKLTVKDLNKAAQAAVALEKFTAENNLNGLAYYYNGLPDSLHRDVVSSFIVGNSILNAEGIPMC